MTSRKIYSHEFKVEAINEWKVKGRPRIDVCKERGIYGSMLDRWFEQIGMPEETKAAKQPPPEQLPLEPQKKRKGRHHFDEHVRREGARRRHAGERAEQIATEIGVSIHSIYTWAKEFPEPGVVTQTEPSEFRPPINGAESTIRDLVIRRSSSTPDRERLMDLLRTTNPEIISLLSAQEKQIQDFETKIAGAIPALDNAVRDIDDRIRARTLREDDMMMLAVKVARLTLKQ